MITNCPKGVVLIPISLGELIDMVTILELKVEFSDNALKELTTLGNILNGTGVAVSEDLVRRLREVNKELWNIEDALREKEKGKIFDESFIQLARSVYHRNDLRASLKREINEAHGSVMVEEKFYLPQ